MSWILHVCNFFFSAKSKQAVECVLAQVEQMSPTEKLLLYLKLPTGKTNVDPLRQ